MEDNLVLLRGLLRGGENSWVDFKRQWWISNDQNFVKDMVAMFNAPHPAGCNEGYFVIGANDDGTPAQPALDKSTQIDTAPWDTMLTEFCSPQFTFELRYVIYNDYRYIIVVVNKGSCARPSLLTNSLKVKTNELRYGQGEIFVVASFFLCANICSSICFLFFFPQEFISLICGCFYLCVSRYAHLPERIHHVHRNKMRRFRLRNDWNPWQRIPDTNLAFSASRTGSTSRNMALAAWIKLQELSTQLEISLQIYFTFSQRWCEYFDGLLAAFASSHSILSDRLV
jgi:hypothetical protein